jgi:hypothetical protein
MPRKEFDTIFIFIDERNYLTGIENYIYNEVWSRLNEYK